MGIKFTAREYRALVRRCRSSLPSGAGFRARARSHGVHRTAWPRRRSRRRRPAFRRRASRRQRSSQAREVAALGPAPFPANVDPVRVWPRGLPGSAVALLGRPVEASTRAPRDAARERSSQRSSWIPCPPAGTSACPDSSRCGHVASATRRAVASRIRIGRGSGRREGLRREASSDASIRTRALRRSSEAGRPIGTIDPRDQPVEVVRGDHGRRSSGDHLVGLLGRGCHHEGRDGLPLESCSLLNSGAITWCDPSLDSLCPCRHRLPPLRHLPYKCTATTVSPAVSRVQPAACRRPMVCRTTFLVVPSCRSRERRPPDA